MFPKVPQLLNPLLTLVEIDSCSMELVQPGARQVGIS